MIHEMNPTVVADVNELPTKAKDNATLNKEENTTVGISEGFIFNERVFFKYFHNEFKYMGYLRWSFNSF